MAEQIFASPIFIEYILPFVLVFTLIFAILQKSKLLGDNTKQINSFISLVVGLILIAFPFSRDFVVLLMPFLAVSVVILFVFMLLYGFIWHKRGDVLHKGVKITLGIIFGLAVITAVLIISGYWEPIYEFLFKREDAGQVWVNVILGIILIGAILAVVLPRGEEREDKEDKD